MKNNESELKERILAELKPLFKTAIKDGLWFYCAYVDIWFSPMELKKAHSENKFIWGPKNWVLRNPNEKIQCLMSKVEIAKKELDDFKSRMELK